MDGAGSPVPSQLLGKAPHRAAQVHSWLYYLLEDSRQVSMRCSGVAAEETDLCQTCCDRDIPLSSLGQQEVSLPSAGGWNYIILKALPQPNQPGSL